MGTHEWIGLTVYDASHRSDVEDKLYKNILAPYLETPKDIATKSGETHVWDKAPLSRKFSRRSTPGICTGQKCIFFLIGDSLLSGYHPMLYIFGKLSSSQCYAATYRFRDTCIRGRTLGFWGRLGYVGLPAKGRLCVRDRYHRAKFHADRCHAASPRYL